MKAVENLTGSLLIAHPDLRDPNFRRTIIFISEHNKEEGASGYVLNRPINDVVPDLPEAPVFFGGPVEPGEVLLASLQWRDNPSLVAFRAFVGPVDKDALKGWEGGLRIFAGYSGWMPGQLENEISENTWIVLPPTRDLIMMTDPENCWKNVLRSCGPLLHLLSEAPENPEWS